MHKASLCATQRTEITEILVTGGWLQASAQFAQEQILGRLEYVAKAGPSDSQAVYNPASRWGVVVITLDQAALNLVSLIQCEKIQLTQDGAKAIVQASETILY